MYAALGHEVEETAWSCRGLGGETGPGVGG